MFAPSCKSVSDVIEVSFPLLIFLLTVGIELKTSVTSSDLKSGSFGSGWVGSLAASQVHQADLADLWWCKRSNILLSKRITPGSTLGITGNKRIHSTHFSGHKRWSTPFCLVASPLLWRDKKNRSILLIDLFVWEGELLSEPFLRCSPNPCRVSSAWRWCWRRRGSGCWSRSCWLPLQSWKKKESKKGCQVHITGSIRRFFRPLRYLHENAASAPRRSAHLALFPDSMRSWMSLKEVTASLDRSST